MSNILVGLTMIGSVIGFIYFLSFLVRKVFHIELDWIDRYELFIMTATVVLLVILLLVIAYFIGGVK